MDFGTACIIVLPIAFFSPMIYAWVKEEIKLYLTRRERILTEAQGMLDYLEYRDGCYVENEEPVPMCEYFINKGLYEAYRNHWKRVNAK